MHAVITSIQLHTSWLYVRLLDTPLFFFDYWSMVHLWSGAVLWLLFRRLALRRPWVWVTSCVVGWELLELIMLYVALHVFRPETLKDQGTDIVVGLLGAQLGERLRSACLRAARGMDTEASVLLQSFVAITIAFAWVGSYGYQYNRALLNSHGVNWWAFLLWATAGLTELRLLARLERSRSRLVQPLAALWFVHVGGLFLIEYFGYVQLGIREIGHPSTEALCVGLIHGTRSLFVFYLSAPLLLHLGWVGVRFLVNARTSAPATTHDYDAAVAVLVHAETAR